MVVLFSYNTKNPMKMATGYLLHVDHWLNYGSLDYHKCNGMPKSYHKHY